MTSARKAGRAPGGAWLADRHTEVAAERILDAAGELFTDHEPGSVGMAEIAAAAGCSRATLYRYFENRDALHRAYAHREARTVQAQLAERLAGIDDPHRRLLAGMSEAIALVRENPALAAWFARADPLGTELADRSEVITEMMATFLTLLGSADPDTVRRRARWAVRMITALLVFPGRDAAEEAAMLAEFVVPILLPPA